MNFYHDNSNGSEQPPVGGSPLARMALPPNRTERIAAGLRPRPATPISRNRVLVVDDDTDIRNVLVLGLRDVGFDVDSAEDGEAGWAILSAEKFDALVTDHEMPRLSGLELIRRVRASRLSIPVILISGRMPREEKELALLLKPGAALAKPLSVGELAITISVILGSVSGSVAEAS